MPDDHTAYGFSNLNYFSSFQTCATLETKKTRKTKEISFQIFGFGF
jgi:hypothetical protein